MKNLYQISTSISVLFLLFVFYRANQENDLRYELYWEWEHNFIANGSYEALYQLSFISSLISLLFIVFYILTFSFSFKHLKSPTSKVMNILGVVFSGIVFLITLLPVVDQGKISFEELSYLLIPYVLSVLSFSIVNLKQVKKLNSFSNSNQSTVDDIH